MDIWGNPITRQIYSLAGRGPLLLLLCLVKCAYFASLQRSEAKQRSDLAAPKLKALQLV